MINDSYKILVVFLLIRHLSIGQTREDIIHPIIEERLHYLSAFLDEQPPDLANYYDVLNHYLKFPINLNTASRKNLQDLRLLSDNQVNNLLKHRSIINGFHVVEELQSVPSFDKESIKRIEPFIRVEPLLNHNWKANNRSTIMFLMRSEYTIEKERGYLTSTKNGYLGQPMKYFSRLRYTNQEKIKLGITAENDAGEPFFGTKQKNGFDFYSAFVQFELPKIKSSILFGDYTIRFAQGLVAWSSAYFGSQNDLSSIMRTGSTFIPSTSANESNFFRGMVLGTNPFKRIHLTMFTSLKNLDATIMKHKDGPSMISSLSTSGLHRTQGERKKRWQVNEQVTGGRMAIIKESFELGGSALHISYDKPFNPATNPYSINRSIQQAKWKSGLDAKLQWKNMRYFGEFAQSNNAKSAVVFGALLNPNHFISLAMLYRSMESGYVNQYANAFSTTTKSENEKGTFIACVMQPSTQLRLQSHMDVYSFPWLTYLIDSPSHGNEWFISIQYSIKRKLEVLIHYKSIRKPKNVITDLNHIAHIKPQLVQNQRIKVKQWIDKNWHITALWEHKSYQHYTIKDKGAILILDLSYQSTNKKFNCSMRHAMIETDSYQTRIYAYEKDVQYAFSVPAYSGNSRRFYILIKQRLTNHITAWFKWSQDYQFNAKTIGSGNEMINGPQRNLLKLQLRLSF